jgi:hypothetical protein
MRFPSLEECGTIVLGAIQAFVKEMEDIFELIKDKIRETF